MLKLKGITKQYIVGENEINALRGIDLEFRKSEFVAILGPSGCGKTTLLNIVGGLDKYTSGDLIINNRSTKDYKDRDWDSYRNHTIGFVFQSYNLIHHQTVLSNVELALTLSGISKADRKKRAIETLESVGLGDQVYKVPNQLSGGQMQRVAIARALVNNPNIILADEPTGALDSETSIQIMELLKEIAKDRLVIMVTHNPDLANKYANRIIRLLDGNITSDSNPYQTAAKIIENKDVEAKVINSQKGVNKSERTSMSFLTAFGLSLKNLLTKKTRTLLVAIAGSIGIIGIALVLSVANGFTGYIDKMQGDTLSAFPLTIESSTMDFSSLMNFQRPQKSNEYPKEKVVYINPIMRQLQESNFRIENNITQEYIDTVIKDIDKSLYNTINYEYGIDMNIYKDTKIANQTFYTKLSSSQWSELATSDKVDQYEFIKTQYDVIGGELPKNKNQVVLVVDKYNELTDMTLQSIGIIYEDDKESISFDDIIGLKYKIILNDAYYTFADDKFLRNTLPGNYITEALYQTNSDHVQTLEIVGIVRPNGDTQVGSIGGSIGYTKALTDYVLKSSKDSEISKWMETNETLNPLTGTAYTGIDASVQRDKDLKKFGGIVSPVKINIYPVSFEAKEKIKIYLDADNKLKKEEAMNQYYLEEGITEETATAEERKEAEKIGKASGVYYTDLMSVLLSTVNTLVNSISIVLIVFTSISLVVSSIMIGVITHISVMERTKEIGILRSIGARKKDISRIFNAESMMIGFLSGTLGMIVSLLLLIPINFILEMLTDISGLAMIHPSNAIILVVISTLLTFIAGFLPAKAAAKRDPVIALRTE